MKTYRLNQPTVLEQDRLVLDVIARDPCLNLVPESLKFLNLCLQIRFKLLLLRLVRRRLHLVVYALEELDTLRNLLQGPVDLRYENFADVSIT